MVTSAPPSTMPRYWLLTIPAILALVLAVVLIVPMTSTSNTQPPKQVACINDDARTCLLMVDTLKAFSNGQIVVTYYPVCTDGIVQAVLAFDLVFVDGVMNGSQYQGPECVTALMAAKAGNPRPAIIAYSTDHQTNTQMGRLGADAETVPTAGIKNIYNIVARLLGLPPVT